MEIPWRARVSPATAAAHPRAIAPQRPRAQLYVLRPLSEALLSEALLPPPRLKIGESKQANIQQIDIRHRHTEAERVICQDAICIRTFVHSESPSQKKKKERLGLFYFVFFNLVLIHNKHKSLSF
jgi:hypothetical protein